MTLSRRTLLTMAAGGALLPLAPGVRVAFGATPTEATIQNPTQNNIVIFLFLRFGMDGLQLLAPADDGQYRDKRRASGLRTTGVNAGRNVGAFDGVPFFLHPQAQQLQLMYDNKSLAFIHAVGVPTGLRSHFEVQELVDKGIADGASATSGWLARHLSTRVSPAGDFAATADSVVASSALNGAAGIVPTSELEYLGIVIPTEQADIIGILNKADNASARSVRQTLKTAAAVREKAAKLPSFVSPNYTYGGLSEKLQPLARVLKLDMGVEVATVDFGGWDHHDNIAQNFNAQARELSNALFAFTDDLGPLMSRVTIVAMTEFGRRVQENANAGTDHGAASVMMVLGAGVNGGKIYGEWPGLADAQLDSGDLRVTTDYRRVLSEVLVKRQGQSKIDSVFPTVAYKPMDILKPA